MEPSQSAKADFGPLLPRIHSPFLGSRGTDSNPRASPRIQSG
jgi:hypothetical protein